jgi:hypothetical protein
MSETEKIFTTVFEILEEWVSFDCQNIHIPLEVREDFFFIGLNHKFVGFFLSLCHHHVGGQLWIKKRSVASLPRKENNFL